MARERTVGQELIRRVGFRKTRKVMTFMACWATVELELGREPTIEEYAAWWKESAATAYREKAIFKECFPEESSPSRLNALGQKEFERRLKSAKEKVDPFASVLSVLRPADLRLSQN